MKWEKEKENLKRLINVENLTYEEIGKKYGCTGANIKKAAYRLGIELPKRRKINQKETFNRGNGEKGFCIHCGNEFKKYESTNGVYCSLACKTEHEYVEFIKRWQNGEESGLKGEFSVSNYIRRFLFEKHNSKCELCGWHEINEYTGKVPLQIHHIDGNCQNNKEENLQLLCPNCHSLTENFGRRNKNATIGRTKYFSKKKNKD